VIGDDVVYLPLHHSLYILQPLVASSNSFEAVEKTSLVVEHLAADLYVAEIAAAEVGGSDDWSHSVWLLGMSSVNQDWRLVMATHDSTSERNSGPDVSERTRRWDVKMRWHGGSSVSQK
jgi:hypothetical protein